MQACSSYGKSELVLRKYSECEIDLHGCNEA